jgi:hypothetical protein
MNGPKNGFKHIFAQITLDQSSKNISWKFTDRHVDSIKEAKQILSETPSIRETEAVHHIIHNLDVDVVVPHMFC